MVGMDGMFKFRPLVVRIGIGEWEVRLALGLAPGPVAVVRGGSGSSILLPHRRRQHLLRAIMSPLPSSSSSPLLRPNLRGVRLIVDNGENFANPRFCEDPGFQTFRKPEDAKTSQKGTRPPSSHPLYKNEVWMRTKDMSSEPTIFAGNHHLR